MLEFPSAKDRFDYRFGLQLITHGGVVAIPAKKVKIRIFDKRGKNFLRGPSSWLQVAIHRQ